MRTLQVRKCIALVSLLLLFSTVCVLAENTVTIVGELIDNYQFITDEGLVFEIGDTEKGAELLGTITEQRIKVTGTLQKTDEFMVIYVVGYEVLKDSQEQEIGE